MGDSVYSTSFPWKEVPRRGGGWLRSGMKRNVRESVFPYRHPERSRGIFFWLRVSSFLRESVCVKHRSVQFIWSMAFPVIRCSRILGLTANGKDFSLSLEMTIWGKWYFCLRRSFSRVSLESYPARYARHLPHVGKAVVRGIVCILPPSHGRRCPEGAEVGFAAV